MYDARSAVRWTATSAAGAGHSVTTETLRGRLAQGLGNDPQASDVLARWDRWGPYLVTALRQLYPTAAHRVVDLIADAHLCRSQVLRHPRLGIHTPRHSIATLLSPLGTDCDVVVVFKALSGQQRRNRH